MDKDKIDGKELPEKLVTEREAAEILKISSQTLRRIRNAREIYFYRIGSRVFYSHEMLRNFLKKSIGGEY